MSPIANVVAAWLFKTNKLAILLRYNEEIIATVFVKFKFNLNQKHLDLRRLEDHHHFFKNFHEKHIK